MMYRDNARLASETINNMMVLSKGFVLLTISPLILRDIHWWID
jgi:hypothetical protein